MKKKRINPDSLEYKKQEMKLRKLSSLHNLFMMMMGYMKGLSNNTLADIKVNMKFTEEIANVMNKISEEFFGNDENITTEEIIEVLDSEWNRLKDTKIDYNTRFPSTVSFNSNDVIYPDKRKLKEIDAEIDKILNPKGGKS